jgi:XTP/dITP diphosphohydrolase
MTLYCATTNPGKLGEFQLAAALYPQMNVQPVPDLTKVPAAEETGETFRDNAIQKAVYYSAFAPGPVFADDSGLSVDALNGAPGVYSARFAGPGATDEENNRLVLAKTTGQTDRRARFVCVIALARDGRVIETFEGIVEGELLNSPRGDGGFGYDPLFYYPPFGCTLAECPADRKMEVSHRGKALRAMFEYLTGAPATH